MLTNNEIKSWRNNGYVIAKNLLDPNLVKQCSQFMNQKCSSIEKVSPDFGSTELQFPSGEIIDQITLNQTLIDTVKTLLQTNDILLSQSDAWSKGGFAANRNTRSQHKNNNQRIHMDYGNHTFLHIHSWDKPDCIAAIVYLSDTTETGGGTAFVPRQHINDEAYKTPYLKMPGQLDYTFSNDKDYAENYFKKNHPEIYQFRQKLYQREQIVKAKVGDILFYRLDLWHRGTPVKIGKIRHVMNLAWKKKEATWINVWNPGWTKKMYYQKIEKLFVSMTPEQRGILGIPLPGHDYWTIEKLDLLKQRYPKINITPYIKSKL